MASVGSSLKRKPIDLPAIRSAVLKLAPEAGFVKLVQKKLQLSEQQVARIFGELMKFLLTVAASKQERLYVPSPIDPLWHWLILDQPYYDRVNEVFGGAMPLHDPRQYGDCTSALEEAQALDLRPDEGLWIN